MNRRIKEKKIRQRNKYLCKRYPFLIPYHRWTGKCMWENKHSWYYTPKYSYTELDTMPAGWKKAFGIPMCEEIREDLIKCNFLNEYRILQIKEKYGELRWYDGGVPVESKAYDIIDKYTKKSRYTCIRCGRPATKISRGWISPYCDRCAEELSKNPWNTFEDIRKD